ncbi:type VI secretion system baseplate subunit TssG [Chitiniphilus purpureus]|uniref:Type VI secretion system baseplate subunit TssG n=1 Tax=Chitiniphilus purpureus TaxID=2981137 RepID=A0ABY6DJM3_9NEIS|nr:type VI secretion system baseplate subunit TssG [Chitiniphilus sp. CD1]UXY14564.1 type VI secretion system baseplate subunit TssG [Chitiniphilus sp. CD1]
MAGAFGRSPRDLTAELAADATCYGFFQGVRLLSLAANRRGEKRRGPLPAKLRFRTVASLAFPPSELVRYRPIETPGDQVEPSCDEMTVAFMGLTGPSGVLPTPYTELLIERRQYYRDTAAHAFFDLFSHRAVALFYGAWRKYRYWLAVEGGEQDGFTRYLLDLSGLGLARLRERLGADDTAGIDETLFIHYAGLLSQKPLSAQAMVTLIEGFFGVRTELAQFVGQWIDVPPQEQTRLGAGACELGLSAFAGERIWDRQTKMQLRLGPMRRRHFDNLLPGKPGADALDALMQFMVGHGLACDVTLVLDKRDVPKPRLEPGQPLLLGGNVWLNSTPPAAHPDQMCYRLLQ